MTLTRRQLEVAKLIAKGYTQPEIAAKLGISVRTVEDHTAKLRRKTGSSTSRKAAGSIK